MVEKIPQKLSLIKRYAEYVEVASRNCNARQDSDNVVNILELKNQTLLVRSAMARDTWSLAYGLVFRRYLGGLVGIFLLLHMYERGVLLRTFTSTREFSNGATWEHFNCNSSAKEPVLSYESDRCGVGCVIGMRKGIVQVRNESVCRGW